MTPTYAILLMIRGRLSVYRHTTAQELFTDHDEVEEIVEKLRGMKTPRGPVYDDVRAVVFV